MKDLWQQRLSEETDFWDGWLGRRGLPELEGRVNLSEPLKPDLAALLRGDGPFLALDVGAGPLTVLGKELTGKRQLTITAVDPLAAEYDKLLEKHGIQPPVRTIACDAEALTSLFPHSTFDLVYARNCLDHAYNPLLAITKMVAVAKPGGYVYFEHFNNERDRNEGRGLHQWNFYEEDGQFKIKGCWGEWDDVSAWLSLRGVVSCTTVPIDEGRWWVVVSFRKA